MFTCGSILILAAGFISSNGHPIDPKVVLPLSNGFGITIVGAALLITTVIALIACTCCKQRRDGFKEFRNPTAAGHIGFTNTLSELSIFPPPVTVQQQHPPADDESPQINAHSPSRPAAFSCVVPSVTDWFVDNGNFPRQQLFYQKEIGKGWFGKVVKGEARGAKVVVRILREDATPEEKGYFLHEAKPFRDLKHKNISRLYGRCLEHDPFLLLFEYCTNGDLKSFLVTNSGSRNAITEQKISLKMMIDVTEGLKFMNEHGFIHTDLAARNCLVASDLTVKIGDYGTSVDKYQNEYYIVGDVAVPIRWCAPETLTCTQTTIETKEVTEGGNVWSLAVLLWEIAEFGKLPYPDMTDEEVITRVLVQGSVRLPPPNCSFGHYLHNVMTLCWRMENRTNIEQILMMLMYLKNNPFQESDFESRWRALKPNTVVLVDNHTPIHSPRHTELAQRPHLTAKLEFDSGVDLEIKPTDENPDSCRTSTPNTVSPQLSVASEDIFQPVQHKSPSMTNLKGSLEDVAQFDSWLMGVEQKTEEDRNFVKNISEAIKNLDETLALEKTSSSSQDSSMESSKKPLLDFKLGPTGNEKKGDSSSSDTEEETWRNRIERGEFTEKVKEKSKSVTDLMVLTHIDSEGSESDSLPSLTRQYSVKKTTVKGVSYTGIGFGSEGNIRNAVLSEELQDKLKQLTNWKTETQSFLVKGASEKNNKTLLFTAAKEASPPIISVSDEESLKPISSSVTTKPIAAASEDIICSQIASFSCDGAPEASDVNFFSNSYSEENSNVNIKMKPVNKESVMKEEKNVHSDCIKDSLVNDEHSIISDIRISESEGTDDCHQLFVDSKQSASSHFNENSVPEIVITESEMSEFHDEPDPSIDMPYVVDVKPRKFVFVCKDADLVSDSSDDEDNSPNDVRTIEPQQERSYSVILGSCEEHTLDYFKGLKTTFTPNVSYVSTSETPVGEGFDCLDEPCVKEESNIDEKQPADNKLPEVDLLRLSDQAVNDLSDDSNKHFNEEHISNKISGYNKSGVEDHNKGEEIISKNNGMNFGGFDGSFLHIIDSFIDNERAYTALSVVPDSESFADISSNSKSFPVEETVEKNMFFSNQANLTSSYEVESSPSFENSSVDRPIDENKLSIQPNLSQTQKVEIPEKHLDVTEIDEKMFFKQVDPNSPFKTESHSSEDSILGNFLETPKGENFFHFMKSEYLTSPSKKENPVLSGSSSEECLAEVPMDESMFSKPADLSSPSTIENPFSLGISSEECLLEVSKTFLKMESPSLSENIFSNHTDLTSPFNDNMCFEQIYLDGTAKIESLELSKGHLVEALFDESKLSKKVELPSPCEMNTSFKLVDLDTPSEIENSVSLGKSFEEHLAVIPVDENKFSKKVELLSLQSGTNFSPVTFPEEHLVHVASNENASSKLVDFDNPSKMENSVSSGNSSDKHSFEAPVDENNGSNNIELSSPCKKETEYSLGTSCEEHFVPVALNKNMSFKLVDLDSPSEIDNSVSSGNSYEEHSFEAPIDENNCSNNIELSSPCKKETEYSLGTSCEEHLVHVPLNKNSSPKLLDLKRTSKRENSAALGNSSPVDNKFTEKLELSSPCKIESTFSSEEHFVEAPFPFNQPESADIHSNITNVKAKSLDSFLSPKNGYEHFVTLRNGLYVEDDSHLTNFVPIFNMTESVSENTFMNQNLYYDPYFSVDSGHSSDRCIEQDKKMNDLKNRLEDVVKSGSDFQLKNSEEEYGGKLLTPDDERSSDSGFRDKGSLSESVEDTCDEKYNLEDIDAELDEFNLKNIDKEDLKYYEQFAEPDQDTTPGWFLHVRPESTAANSKESGWLSQSTEDEERLPLTIDAEFAAAIRNELKEKLPCAQQVEKTEEDASPELEPATDKFTYPSQLSPILEEQESNQSSLQLNDCSPVFILPPPEIKTDTFKQDIVKAFESLESPKNGIIMEDLEDGNGLVVFRDDKIIVDDDVLIVDTETNEAVLIESPKPQSHLAFILTKKEPEVFIDNDSPEVNSDVYVLTPDNASLTPNSVNTDSHSSPENANMSGLFLSPCSIRSDLFDSGPPSLPFDLGQSLEEVEDIPACEETVTEIFTLGICNGDISDNIVENEKSILKENETELIDNKKIDAMKVELSKDSTNMLLEPLSKLKDHEENNKKLYGIEVTLDPLSPADSNLNKSLSDEKVSKHLRAEVEIDRLLSRSNKENEIENTNHLNTNSTLRNDWLKDLFTNNINSAEINSKEDKNHVNSNLRKTDWPTIEELVYEKRPEKNEPNSCLKPNITSTLALMSPDLSSADSKSLASSFSSTPSSDENKTVAMSTEDSDSLKSSEKLAKPNTLNLKSDASGAPMPSPEDAEKGWRPTICQLMELTDQAAADGEEMTTSFIEPDENGIYTPDWESDISEEQSSSSGEFVWKNDEIIGGGMERIEEEDEDCSSCNDSDTSSETSSSAEFVPSTWNAMAIPMKSALKVNVPQKKNEQKRVVFKKEKYQCIYEYPREESDNEEEEFSPGMWQTPTTPVFDYSVFADWELGDGEIISTPIDSVDSDSEDSKKTKKEEAEFDFYRLDYNPGPYLERPWSDSLPEDDADFSPLAADLAPVRLGDLRHTKATLRLELPQLRPDQGEASILDSVSDAPP